MAVKAQVKSQAPVKAVVASSVKSAPSKFTFDSRKKSFFSLQNLQTLVLLVLFIRTTPDDKLETPDHKTWAEQMWTMFTTTLADLFSRIIDYHCGLEVPNMVVAQDGTVSLTKAGLALATTVLSANFKSGQKGINADEVVKNSTPPYLVAVGCRLLLGGFDKFLANKDFVPSESFLYGSKDRPGIVQFFVEIVKIMDDLRVLDEVVGLAFPGWVLEDSNPEIAETTEVAA
jgi:hypothetical protein